MKLAGIGSRSFNKATGLLVAAGFVAWSATHVAEMIWHVLAPDTQLSASGLMSESGFAFTQQAAVDQPIDLERLQSVFVLRPMGQFSGPSLTSESGVQAADTQLALTLKGAVASSDPSRSRAIIASADAQEIYQSGQSLNNAPGNVVLQEIHPTYVLLDNNGRIEALRMDEAQAPAELPAVAPVVTTQNSATASSSFSLPAGIDSSSALTDLVRIQPVFEASDSALAGSLRGLQIRHGSRQDFLAAVGLQQGDLITAVDGRRLQATADLPALMSRLSSQQAVSLQVLRDQTSLTVELDRSRW